MTLQENLETPEFNADKTLEFLKFVHPAGPWTLTYIAENKDPNADSNVIIRARTFDEGREGQMMHWIEEMNGRVNLYWQINPLNHAPAAKAKLQDVMRVTRFHVDLDPRKGLNDRDGEREIIRGMLDDEDWLRRLGLPGGPTFSLDSGNGYWAFWELAQPILLGASEEGERRAAAAEVGRHNRWIAEILNEALDVVVEVNVRSQIADTCHNIDRISRLPGTINIPDGRKIDAGYKRELSGLYLRHSERLYSADQFKKSDVVSHGAGATAAELKAVTIGEITRILPTSSDPYEIGQELQRLYPAIGDKTIQLICLGEYIDDDEEGSNLRDKTVKGGNLAVNRSRAHWRANRHMQWVGVPLNVILGVLCDERLPISAHGIEPIDERTGKRGARRSGRELIRFNEAQIRKCALSIKKQLETEARAEAVLAGQREAPPAGSEGEEKNENNNQAEPPKNKVKSREDIVRELNNRHAVLEHEGGKCLILSWETSEFGGREIPILQTLPDFKNRYAHLMVQVGTNTKTKEPTYKTYADAWFTSPRRRQYRSLRFLPGAPREVDGYLNLWRGWAVEPVAGDWSRMRQHILEVLACGNEEYNEYILNWAAWAVQNPDRPAEVALVFRGEKGVGKGIFGRAMQRLFGTHGLQITHQNNITGKFNGHLRSCCLLFADEAVSAGDKQAESVLKGLITEPQLQIERKRIDMTAAKNYLHIIMASNEEWVVPASGAERRFAVFDVANTYRQSEGYFGPLYAEIEDERNMTGLAAMLHDLLNRDIGTWHPRKKIPQTEALRKQKEISLTAFDQFILNMLEEGGLRGRPCGNEASAVCSLSHGGELGLYDIIRDSSPKLRNISHQVLATQLKKWGCEHYRHRPTESRGWLFPALAKMRAQWDAEYWPHKWSTAEDGWGMMSQLDNNIDEDVPF